MRKPARAVLTLLSVMIAFTLFGLTLGHERHLRQYRVQGPHGPHLYRCAFRRGHALALAEQIKRLPGVAEVGMRVSSAVITAIPRTVTTSYFKTGRWAR